LEAIPLRKPRYLIRLCTLRFRNFAETSFACVAAIGLFLTATGAPALAEQDHHAVSRSLERFLLTYEVHNLEVTSILERAKSNREISFLVDNRRLSLTLRPRDLRSPRYRAETALDGGGTRSVRSRPVQSYEGEVKGIAGAQARFTLREDSLEGVILTPEEWYFIEPLRNFSEAALSSEFLVYRKSDLKPDAIGRCGVSLVEKVNQGMELLAPMVYENALTNYVVEIATEADYEYVTGLGGPVDANNEILNILNQVEGVYQTELSVSFEVVYQHTWDTSSDPYSSTAPSTMLQEFTDYWNTHFFAVNYDLAHLWTGKDLDGSTVGIAWKEAVCFRSYAYGVSQKLAGTPARFILTAHEMGHNFGASHPDQENPPHSECATTIMNSSISSSLSFCQFSRDQINGYLADHSSCLGSGTESVSPSNLTATAASTSQVNLSWQDNSSNEMGFKIQRKTGPAGTWSQIEVTAANVVSYSDTGLNANTTYFYRVQAYNNSGDSIFSNEASVTTANAVPVILQFSPTSGPVGTGITITGSNLTGATSVKFNNTPAVNFRVDTATQVTAMVPAGAATGPISITTPLGTAVSSPTFMVINCSYSLSPSSQAFPSNGGSGSLNVNSTAGCGWTASSNANWITITSGATGLGSASLSFTVGSNSSTDARTGALIVAGQTFTVSQAGVVLSCSYSLSSPSQSFEYLGGTGQVYVTSRNACSWSAVSNVEWVTVSSGDSGNGSGMVTYQVAGNSGKVARIGTICIAGQLFVVSQAASQTGGNDKRAVFLPIVLASAGMNGSFFTSELTLINRGSRNAVLEFTYTASIGSGSGQAQATLEAGKQQIIPDVISYLRSLGVPIPTTGNQGGTLLVQFTGLSSPSDGMVSARTTTAIQEGRAGLAYNGISVETALTGSSYLCGLRQDKKDRSNVAIQNVGEAADGNVTLRLTVYSGDPATPVAKVLPDESLPAGGFKQISGILNSNGLSLTNGYVRVERVSGTAPYYAYAVINDQVTSDGSFVSPITEADLIGKRRLTLPVVVENANFSSELIVTNWSPSSKTLVCHYVADGIQTANSTATFTLDVKPGEQLLLPDIVQVLRDRGVTGIGLKGPALVGPLFAEVSAGDLSGVSVTARTSSAGGGGHFGLFYGSVAEGTACQVSTWIYGLQQNDQSRSNLALVNTAEIDSSDSNFRIELFDGRSGLKVKSLESITLKAKGWMQIGSILSQYAPGTTQGYIKITKTSGNNPFIAYAVINDGAQPGQGTGDGAFLLSSR
jgi:hypothetical protein